MNILDCKHILGEYLMETKVIKPLLRSLFLSYVLSALFLGVLAFALYKLRLRESLVNLLTCKKPPLFLGTAVRNVLFSGAFCSLLRHGSQSSH